MPIETKINAEQNKDGKKMVNLDTKLREIAWLIRRERKKGDHLATRVSNCLREINPLYKTVRDLKELGKRERLLGYREILRNFGEQSLNRLNEYLSQYGIKIENKNTNTSQ